MFLAINSSSGMHQRNQAIARMGYQELNLIQWTMLIEPIHLPIPSITVLGYQGNHCTCIWLFGTPRFLAAKCQIQKVSPVLNVEAREFQPKIENYDQQGKTEMGAAFDIRKENRQ